MSNEMDRRDFLGLTLGGLAVVGGAASLVPMKKSWDPLPSVISAGFTTVDLSGVEAGILHSVEWRGKPVFILKKTEDMEKCEKRDLITPSGRFVIALGICTHLGCIPKWETDNKIFKCACHGGEFDACGKNTFGPPPRPLDIPPFSVDLDKLVLGEEGPEYRKIVKS